MPGTRTDKPTDRKPADDKPPADEPTGKPDESKTDAKTDEAAPAAIWSWDELPETEAAPVVASVGSKINIEAEVPEPIRTKVEALWLANSQLAEVDPAALFEIMYGSDRVEAAKRETDPVPFTDEESTAVGKRSADTADKLSKSSLKWEWRIQRLMSDSASKALEGDQLAAAQKAAEELVRLMKRYGKYRPDGQITVRAFTLDAPALKTLKIDASPGTIIKFQAKPLEKRTPNRLPGTASPIPVTADGKQASVAAIEAANAGKTAS